jgi:hypothetical protein
MFRVDFLLGQFQVAALDQLIDALLGDRRDEGLSKFLG